MAESRHRHKHPHHHVPPPQAGRRDQNPSVRKAGLILAVFLGLIGLAIGFFAVGSTTAMSVGAVVGIVAGFLIGIRIDRAAEKKKL
jgi:hypothetical protein